jgi:hypothetical protein
MPKILDDTVAKVQKRGLPKRVAYGIAVSSLQKQGLFKKNSQELTEKGKKMNRLLTPNMVAGMSKKKKKKETGSKIGAKKTSSASKAIKGSKTNKKMTTKKKK